MKLRIVVIIVGVLGSPLLAGLFAQGPIQVNSTAMTVSPSDGLCTLPEAINSANSDLASGAAAGECRAGVFGFDAIALPPGTYTAHAPYTTFPSSDQGLGLPVIRSPIEIVGDHAATSIIERSGAVGTPEFRVFYVQYTGFEQYEQTGSLVLRRVTVRNGKIGSAAGAIYIQGTNQTSNAVLDSVVSDNESTWGGAVYATAPVFTIRRSVVERNRARAGGSGVGAVFVSGRLIVEQSRFESNRSEDSAGAASVGFMGTIDISDSVFLRNSARGSSGALGAGGATVNITRSWLHANRAESDAGAIGAERLNMSHTSVTDNVSVNGSGGGAFVIGSSGWTVVSDSTFTGNVAGGSTGGGIYAVALEMTNTTVSGNQATDSGGGISIYGTQNTYLRANNITVTNNVVTAAAGLAGGVSFGSAPATLTNSIVAGNVVGADQRAPDCWGWVTAQSMGHNIIGNGCGCGFAPLSTDRVGSNDFPIDPLLGALQANGGPTLTHLPLAGSPAIDSASPLTPGSDPAAATVLDQRGVARPQDGDVSGTAVPDRGATELAGDSFPTRPSFSAATYSVDEPGGSVDITVHRTDGTGDVAMQYSTAPGSATAGPDYLATSGSLTFLNGETTKTFSIAVLDDALREGTESIRLALRFPDAPVDSQPASSAMLFIKDDDAFPLFRADDAASDEGAASTHDVGVTVRLYAPYPFNVSVAYSTVDGTATAGEDYDAASGVVTIGGGTTSASFVLKVRGDLVDELDEYFKVRLVTTIGCVSEIRYATVTIRDDDLSNRPPSLIAPPDRTNVEGESASLQLIASDLDGDPLTYGASGLPPGIAIDPLTGAIGGMLPPGSQGSYTVDVTVSDGQSTAARSFRWIVTPRPSSNRQPVCDAARPTVDVIWPPNHKKTHAIGVLGVTDADGDPISISITAIWQDEPTNTVGDGNTPIDGYGVGTSQADVRAERSGTPQVPGDGRLYEIFFTARDGAGGSCAGVVRAGVPHDLGQRRTVIDSLVRYDSTTGMRIR